jgi:hypothetical protein
MKEIKAWDFSVYHDKYMGNRGLELNDSLYTVLESYLKEQEK